MLADGTDSGRSVLPEEVAESLKNVEVFVNDIEVILRPFFEKNTLSEYYTKLTPLETARLNLLISFALNTLFFGADPSTHPVMKEIARVKEYIQKLRQLEGVAPAEEAPEIPKRIKRLDAAAASRLIEHGTGKKRKPIDNDNPATDDVITKKSKSEEKSEAMPVIEENISMVVEKKKRTPEERAAKKLRIAQREERKRLKEREKK